jgi:hypothetical protein
MSISGTTVDLNFEVQEPDQRGKIKRVAHTFKVNIPKGLVDGQKMLLHGKGGKGVVGGRVGNLYLTIDEPIADMQSTPGEIKVNRESGNTIPFWSLTSETPPTGPLGL